MTSKPSRGRPKSQRSDAVRNVSRGTGAKAAKVPAMFRGTLGAVSSDDREQQLGAKARRRIRETVQELGEARGWLQEQVEWLRHWVAEDRIEPKDALTAMRGLSKVLSTIEAQGSTQPVAINIGLDRKAIADAYKDAATDQTVQLEGTGDRLQVH